LRAPLTHVLLHPVVGNPTPTVCHNSGPASSDNVITADQWRACHNAGPASCDDVILADQWRRSLVMDNDEPYVSVVSEHRVSFSWISQISGHCLSGKKTRTLWPMSSATVFLVVCSNCISKLESTLRVQPFTKTCAAAWQIQKSLIQPFFVFTIFTRDSRNCYSAS